MASGWLKKLAWPPPLGTGWVGGGLGTAPSPFIPPCHDRATKGVFKREGALLHPKKFSHKLRLEFAEDKYPNGDERRSLLFISFPQPSMFWSSKAYNNRYRQIILEVSKDEDCFAPDLNDSFSRLRLPRALFPGCVAAFLTSFFSMP